MQKVEKYIEDNSAGSILDFADDKGRNPIQLASYYGNFLALDRYLKLEKCRV